MNVFPCPVYALFMVRKTDSGVHMVPQGFEEAHESVEFAQWVEAGGSFQAMMSATTDAIEAIESARGVPEALYDHARDAYATHTLPELRKAIRWLEWAIRITCDQSLEQGWMSQRALAEAAGVTLQTIQRWKLQPVVSDGGAFGPGAIPDGRRKK